jgi:hypothetical protein
MSAENLFIIGNDNKLKKNQYSKYTYLDDKYAISLDIMRYFS